MARSNPPRKAPLAKSEGPARAEVSAEPLREVESLSFNLLKFGETRPTADSTPLQSNAAEPEDEFKNFYLSGSKDAGVIPPPVDLKLLDAKANENNALGPCIEAMVTNIDGTGFTFVARDEDEKDDAADDAKLVELKDFFSEPWPGQSFTTQRRAVRRDLERVGNGYLEVLKTAAGAVAMIRHVDAKMMRLVRLDDAVPVQRTVRRGGKDVTLTVMERERRFVQLVNGRNLCFFKAFGASRDLNKVTGAWAKKGERLPANVRATEIIHFTVNTDARTPYGLPRWIAQTPSVVGSRLAEEFNMDFFNHGGVPPVMLLLQGGVMSHLSRQALQAATRGGASKNNRVQVVEIDPTGAFDKTSNAKVTVERFGSERQADSMFENYDEKCEVRVRRAFRLPPIFVGQAADYSFATAFASYTVAEAQVFKPERDEFDEVISIILLPAMGYGAYKMKSNALNIEDATLKLEGLQLLLGLNAVSPEDMVKEVNATIGTNLKADPAALKRLENTANGKNPDGSDPAPPVVAALPGAKPAPGAKGGAPPPKGGLKAPKVAAPAVKAPTVAPPKPGAAAVSTTKSEDLATDLLDAIASGDTERLGTVLPLLGALGPQEAAEFSEALAGSMFVDTHHDETGLAELAGCTMAMIAAQSHHTRHREAA